MREFSEVISGHNVRYTRRDWDEDSSKLWGFCAVCSVQGVFIDYAPTLCEARDKARETLRQYGREHF